MPGKHVCNCHVLSLALEILLSDLSGYFLSFGLGKEFGFLSFVMEIEVFFFKVCCCHFCWLPCEEDTGVRSCDLVVPFRVHYPIFSYSLHDDKYFWVYVLIVIYYKRSFSDEC